MAEDKEPKTQVNERNTKQEIWEAYNRLLAQLEGKEPETTFTSQKSVINDALRSLADLKLTLGNKLEEIGDELLKDLNSLQDIRSGIASEKQRVVSSLRNQQQQLEQEIQNVKEAWQTEKKRHEETISQERRELELKRKREEEEYQYALSVKRRDEKDEYDRKRAELEREAQIRQDRLAEQEQETLLAGEKLAAMPSVIEEEVKKATEELRKELEAKHSRVVHELTINHEHATKIAELAKTALEETTKTQEEDIQALKQQLAEASRQLKDMAVSVIENRSAKTQVSESPGQS